MTEPALHDPSPTLADFTGAVGEPFVLTLAHAAVTLTLAAAIPTPVYPTPMMRTQPFSLTFQSDSADVLPQAIDPLRSTSLGTIGIFIVAVERNAAGIVYEAVFA